jgi:hypothetical protein
MGRSALLFCIAALSGCTTVTAQVAVRDSVLDAHAYDRTRERYEASEVPAEASSSDSLTRVRISRVENTQPWARRTVDRTVVTSYDPPRPEHLGYLVGAGIGGVVIGGTFVAGAVAVSRNNANGANDGYANVLTTVAGLTLGLGLIALGVATYKSTHFPADHEEHVGRKVIDEALDAEQEKREALANAPVLISHPTHPTTSCPDVTPAEAVTDDTGVLSVRLPLECLATMKLSLKATGAPISFALSQ